MKTFSSSERSSTLPGKHILFVLFLITSIDMAPAQPVLYDRIDLTYPEQNIPSLHRSPSTVARQNTLDANNTIIDVETQNILTEIVQNVIEQLRHRSHGRVILGINGVRSSSSLEERSAHLSKVEKKMKIVDEIVTSMDLGYYFYNPTRSNPDSSVLERVSVLQEVGLVVLNFDGDIAPETIRSSLVRLWKTNHNVWLIEPELQAQLRQVTPSNQHPVLSGNPFELSTWYSWLQPNNTGQFMSGFIDVLNDGFEQYLRGGGEVTSKKKPISDRFVPNDPLFDSQWGSLNSGDNGLDIRAAEAWKILNGLPARGEIKVAHIDTGVTVDHPDLAEALWRNPGEIPDNGIDDDENGYIDDVHGWNFGNKNNDLSDPNGHGTHTAGIIAARGNNGLGIAGVDWQAQIMALKVSMRLTDVVEAINYSILMKAPLSSNSWGFNHSPRALEMAVRSTYNNNQLFVCAVDNKGKDNTRFSDFPPNFGFPNMIRVASIDPNGSISSFSNYGANNVDVAAPGRDIISTKNDGTYVFMHGTSAATPFVSGIAAMLWSVNNSLPYETVKHIIMDTVTPVRELNRKVISNGLVNALEALKAALYISS